MLKGLDASQPVDPQAAKNAGYSLIIRYISDYPSKNITSAERDAYLAAGLDIALVWENGSDDARGGYPAGTHAGAKAKALAQALNKPVGSIIFYAVDFDSSNALPEVTEYGLGFEAGLGGEYSAAPYGSYYTLKAAQAAGIPGGWQTEAWSYGKTLSSAWLLQKAQGPGPVGGTPIDLDVILTVDYGGWSTRKMVPDFNPPIHFDSPGVVSVYCPPTGGVYLLTGDGAVYAFAGAKYCGGANGKPYFQGGRVAAHIGAPESGAPAGTVYTIVDTAGEKYNYPGP